MAGTALRASPHGIAGIDTDAPSVLVARALIGVGLYVDGVGGMIVETEAYDRNDPASHAHRGPTPRNAAMFGPSAHAYVYLSYGIHCCFNVVCGPAGHGAGVLIRAIEPLQGLDLMRLRRQAHAPELLCAGPGRLGQALAITRVLNGRPLTGPPFLWVPAAGTPAVIAGPRIGITKAAELPWRFGLRDSPFLSRPFPKEEAGR